MKMKDIYAIIGFLLLSLVFSSCTKVIDVDINEANQRIVIDAFVENNLSDTTASFCQVKLSKTGSFYENNSFDIIADAKLFIKDKDGNSHELLSYQNGYYNYMLTPSVELNDELELYGTIEGEEITAKAIMPRRVKIDSVVAMELPFGPKHKGITPIVFFTDTPGEDNYYRMILSINNQKVGGFYVTYDLGHNGGVLNYPFMGIHVEKNDTVRIDLLGISKFDYDYYRVIIQTQKSGGFSAAPGNPNTNIEGNAIGVFTAQSFDSKSIIVQ
jgi:hypothetical protein